MTMTNDDKLALDRVDAMAADFIRDIFNTPSGTSSSNDSSNGLNLVSTVDDDGKSIFTDEDAAEMLIDLSRTVNDVSVFRDLYHQYQVGMGEAETVETALPTRKGAYNARKVTQGRLTLASTDIEASEFLYQDCQPGLGMTTPGLTLERFTEAKELLNQSIETGSHWATIKESLWDV